MGEMGK
ncbi:unnamed protein product, partial [Rotaria sordida]